MKQEKITLSQLEIFLLKSADILRSLKTALMQDLLTGKVHVTPLWGDKTS